MNSERKKSAVICMQRMFRAQKTSAANVDGWGWSFFSSLYQKLLTGHPITSDKGTVRSWITKEWSEQRKIFKAVSQDTREIQDPLEQATEVFDTFRFAERLDGDVGRDFFCHRHRLEVYM